MLTNACTAMCSTGTPCTVQNGSGCCVPCFAEPQADVLMSHENRFVGLVLGLAHLIFIWVTALPEPQAQKLFVDAQGLLASRMPLLIAVCQPVPGCHRGTSVQRKVCQLQVVVRAEQGWQARWQQPMLVWQHVRAASLALARRTGQIQ